MLEGLIKYLVMNGEKEQAVSLLNTLEKHATRFEEYDDVSKCFFKNKIYGRAIECAEKTLLVANTPEQERVARTNLTNVYNHANEPEKALEHIGILEQLQPDNHDVKLEKAYSLYLMTQRDEAEALLTDVLLNSPDLSEEVATKIKFNLGTYYMYRDEFQKGLSLFLFEGKKMEFWQQAKLPFAQWDSVITPGKTLILFAEAGIGDEIINVRFMKYLTERGMNPIWLTSNKHLASIFNRNGFKTITDKLEIPHGSVWVYPMTLPVYLKLEYKDLWYGPYLTPDLECNVKYDYMKSSKLKIGIRWQGNPDYDNDLHRSVPVKDIYESLKHIDAEFYSLQRDVGLEEIADFPGLIPMHQHMESFEDTLSIIDQLDIVITSCTSVAHASAAMGKKTLIFVPISAYYLWSHSMKQSPWYGDNVVLFRQKRPREWVEPLNELAVFVSSLDRQP